MPLSPGYVDFVLELIAGCGKVEARRMFGGAALYRGGVGFAILDNDTFFLKGDAAFGSEMKKQGAKPWSYSVKKDGTVRDFAYWSLPDTALDDPDEASSLAKRSHQIAVKAAVEKARKPNKTKAAPKKKAPVKRAPVTKAARRKPKR